MDETPAIVLFVFVAALIVAFLVLALAIPVGIAAHIIWNLLAYGWGVV